MLTIAGIIICKFKPTLRPYNIVPSCKVPGKERSNNGIEERIQLPVLLWALAPKK
jgi:hypothetical protein